MDLESLYQEVVIDHNRHPRNFGRLEPADRSAEGHNPLCGDDLLLTLRLERERISEMRFEGQGCAISTASASLMSEAVQGLELRAACTLLERFLKRVTDPAAEASPELGKLEALAGVRKFPGRVKCATLCWHTLKAALNGGERNVSTE